MCTSNPAKLSQSTCELLVMLLLILLALLAGVARAERMTGFYVDNGYDQTVMHRVTTLRQKREIEYEILNLLDIPEPPRKRRSASVSLSRVKHSAPKFLLDIYKKTLKSSHKYDRDFEFNHSQNTQTIDESDAIMTFAAQRLQDAGSKHEQGTQLWFDVSKVPAYEHVLGAELRLYHSPETARTFKVRGSLTLVAHRVLRPEDGERELRYIDSVNISSIHEGWVILNISDTLHSWLQDPTGNQGLYLSVHSSDRHVNEMKPEDIGFGLSSNDAERQTFMVAFFKNADLREHSTRQKREFKRNKRSDNLKFDFRKNYYFEPQMPRWSRRTCHIRTLYVSFKDLKWQDRIIAPDGYDANYCSGECNFPLNAHMNATNHAILQSFLHLRFPERVPKPCCAPTKLSSLSVIYYVDEDNVILKKYKEMVVKNCGCH